MHDPADHPAIVNPLDATYIRRQMRLNPRPLRLAQPKQIPTHAPDPLPKRIRILWNQDWVAAAAELMSFDPSLTTSAASLATTLWEARFDRVSAAVDIHRFELSVIAK
jgi:hypothetical protein